MTRKELDKILKIIKNLDKIMNSTYKQRLEQNGKIDTKIISLFDKQYNTLRNSIESLTTYVDNNLETSDINITIQADNNETENFKNVGLFDFWCWNFYLSDEAVKIAKNYRNCSINGMKNINLSTKTALYDYIETKGKFK